MELDLSKLDDADKLTLLRNLVSTGKIVAKCTQTSLDDLFFQMLDGGIGPRVVGSALLEAHDSADVSKLDPASILVLIQLAKQIWDMFRKK